MSKTKTERFASVWDALADTAEEAANLKVRAELMKAGSRQADPDAERATPASAKKAASKQATKKKGAKA